MRLTELVNGKLSKDIKYSLWTTVWPLIITCVIYLFMGLSLKNIGSTGGADEVLNAISSNFKVSPIALIPMFVVIALLLLKVPAVPAIIGGAIAAAFVAVFYQGMPFAAAFSTMYKGYTIQTGVKVVDSLLNRGGITSMSQSIFILISAVILGGMLNEIGVIGALLKPFISKLNSAPKVIGATLLTHFFINFVGSAVWLTNILTAELMVPVYKKNRIQPEILSRTLMDGAVASIIFPWHAMTIYFTGVLGCTWGQYVPYIFFSYLAPVFAMICACTGKGMFLEDEKSDSADTQINKVS